jgi:membrane associated rhomboid family serine protease
MDNLFLLIIIAATVLVSVKGFNDRLFFNKYQFHVGSIRSGEQIRMISSGFLHADVMHLAFNMFALYSFAPVVSNQMGNYSFLLIYFGSLIFGNLLTLLFHANNYGYSAIGASGAVTGVIYSAILLEPNMIIGIFGVIPMPAYIFGIGYLLYSIYGMKAKRDNIGHTAHFGGAIGGYVITLLKFPILLQEHTVMVVLLAVPILLLFVLAKWNKL